ncbi:hypothetical protein [Streptomyces sp. GS7]|uniref:hypothetical protein n=1 Tax=Streptomyces sp. GS7 TaxID=2692234 RepID=UPI00131822C6|nr:hypothetical protein [Streptomyces sp. GS7]QHC24555.1 hypothetical protein GR130_27460 [Streptomyces sp. GS7]
MRDRDEPNDRIKLPGDDVPLARAERSAVMALLDVSGRWYWYSRSGDGVGVVRRVAGLRVEELRLFLSQIGAQRIDRLATSSFLMDVTVQTRPFTLRGHRHLVDRLNVAGFAHAGRSDSSRSISRTGVKPHDPCSFR